MATKDLAGPSTGTFDYAPAPESRSIVDLRPSYGLFVDGEFVDGTGEAFKTVNPATEEVLGPVADGTAADMEAAVTAARRAFDSTTWATDHAFRASCLRQLQHALES